VFVRWSGLRHPRDLGSKEVEAFLTMLATERRVSSSTHRQALSALLFLYKEVLGMDLPWMQELQRPAYTRRIPTVLAREEVGLPKSLAEQLSRQIASARVVWEQDRNVSTTMIYTHVLKVAAGGAASPLDALH
jgi:site-specific recombinase XerD